MRTDPCRVIWIDFDPMLDPDAITGLLPDFHVVFVRQYSEFPVAQEADGVAAVFMKLPLDGVSPFEAISAMEALHRPFLVQDPGLGVGKLVASQPHNPETFLLLTPAPSHRIACMLRSLVQTRMTEQAAQLASACLDERTSEPWRKLLIGNSAPMQRLAELIRLVAPRHSSVLITGETGTGKEVVARAIHMASGRSKREMVAVNCSALPDTLLESELFGHAKGAFTGAANPRAGRFEQAHQSSLLLDEIGDLPFDLQSKLLRVLQEREFQRLGGTETIRVDTRVIAATNVDLAEAVEQRKFRGDLFYRLKVVPIRLPPLRHRSGDIPLLTEHFIEKTCRRESLPSKSVHPGAMERLEAYRWPGNVRELEHAIESAVVLSGSRRMLEASDFDQDIEPPARESFEEPFVAVPEEGLDFDAMMSNIQRHLLREALAKAGGNKSRAADMLRMKRSTLVSKVKMLSGEGAVYPD